MTKKSLKLPEILFIKMERDGDSVFPLNYNSVLEAVSGEDGIVTMGQYNLVNTFKAAPSFRYMGKVKPHKLSGSGVIKIAK